MGLAAFNLHEWIEKNRDRLKPPVGNDQLWKDENPDFMVMVVGGPNTRKDYHVDESEEFFYQVEGDITLKIVEDGEKRDVHIKEGDVFLLPPGIPHSPQRPADTIGLVVERKRKEGELDGFVWYCDNCGEKIHEEFMVLTDITTQLKPVFEKFWADESARTCGKCGDVLQPPPPVEG